MSRGTSAGRSIFAAFTFLAISYSFTATAILAAEPAATKENAKSETAANSESTATESSDIPKAEGTTEAGQDDLDKALDLKVKADDADGFSSVIDLCESAIKKGLGPDNLQFAKELLAESAFERAKKQIQELIQGKLGQGANERLRKRVISDLEKVIENDPKLGEAFILLAQIFRGEDLKRSLEIMSKAIAALETSTDEGSSEKLSEAFVIRSTMQKDIEARQADLRRAIEINPKNNEGWRFLIATLAEDKSFDEVAKVAEDYLADNEDAQDVLVIYIDALGKLDRVDEATKLLDKKIESKPDNPLLYALRSDLAFQTKDFDKALADATKLVELNGQNAEAYLTRARVRFGKAQEEEAKDEDEIWQLAKQDIDKCLDLKPGIADAYILRANLAAALKKYDEAIQDVTLLIQNKPNEPKLMLYLANLYQLDDRPGMAIKIADQLIRARVSGSDAYTIRGNAYLSLGEQAEAIADFERALDQMNEEDQQRSGLLNNLAWILATSPDEALRDSKRSIELGTKACELTKFGQPHILSTLAAGYAEAGDFDNAIKWSEEAVELGKSKGSDQLDQLEKELQSYRDKKPWREKQEVKEKKQPLINPGESVET